MPKIKFSISYEIKEEQIERFINENIKIFQGMNSKPGKILAAQILGVQMMEKTLEKEELRSNDFKVKVYE